LLRHRVRSGSGDHPVSYTLDICDSFPGSKAAGGMKVTTYFRLVPRLQMRADNKLRTSNPHTSSWRGIQLNRGTTLILFLLPPHNSCPCSPSNSSVFLHFSFALFSYPFVLFSFYLCLLLKFLYSSSLAFNILTHNTVCSCSEKDYSSLPSVGLPTIRVSFNL